MAAEIFDRLQQILDEIKTASPRNAAEVEQFRIKYLGSKNILKPLMGGIREVANEQKREFGHLINTLKKTAEEKFQSLKTAAEQAAEQADAQQLDLTAPGRPQPLGSRHPISIIMKQIVDIFARIGFTVAEDREIEDDWHNNPAKNTPADHPARDMQDTVWTADGNLLRTHTSSVQVRAMSTLKPPFRIIAPGRVFRYEETDATHENTFHQVEGMLIDRDVSTAHLIYIMKTFLSAIFERDMNVRLRPGYFPFGEPGFELEYQREDGSWLELLPCGLVHPNVLAAGGIDPEEWSGFAFGLGLDRLVMIRYGIEDIRHFLSGNLRFLQQF